jgi:hypothetical protein
MTVVDGEYISSLSILPAESVAGRSGARASRSSHNKP